MRYRKLGDSDIEVSEISLGSWLTYGGGRRARADRGLHAGGVRRRHQLLRHLERLRGRRRRGGLGARSSRAIDRDSYVLATKVFFPMSETDSRPLARADPQADRRLARRACRPTTSTSTSAIAPTRDADRGDDGGADRGRARRARCARSGSASGRRSRSSAGLEVPGAAKFVSSQPQYNMIWRAPEAELFPLCAEHGISQIVWSPLAQGVLTGKYTPGEPPAVGLARRQRRDGLGDGPLHGRRGARGGPAPRPDRRGRRARAWSSWRSPGCCAARRSPRRSSAPRDPSRSTPTPRPPGSSSRADVLDGDRRGARRRRRHRAHGSPTSPRRASSTASPRGPAAAARPPRASAASRRSSRGRTAAGCPDRPRHVAS